MSLVLMPSKSPMPVKQSCAIYREPDRRRGRYAMTTIDLVESSENSWSDLGPPNKPVPDNGDFHSINGH
jgi:hypothetical protein